jgi:hypothetical protein
LRRDYVARFVLQNYASLDRFIHNVGAANGIGGGALAIVGPVVGVTRDIASVNIGKSGGGKQLEDS